MIFLHLRSLSFNSPLNPVLLARLYDHARKEFSYGFRMLTLCWSDGNTLLPVSHTLLLPRMRSGGAVLPICG